MASRCEGYGSRHLDCLRGLAAVAVLAYHVRYRFFLDYADVPSPSVWSKLFYAATSFGHDAVIVFFVLSGYLIGATVLRTASAEQWSWQRYGTNRLVRLYVVLIPGLLATLFWDHLGLHCFGDSPIYTGAPQQWRHDFFAVGERLTLTTFLANAAFMQTIMAPPLGSNDPLWSLAFELWFYVLFPLLVIGIVGRARLATRLLLLLGCVVVFVCVGRSIALYFPIWLFGAAVACLPPVRIIERYLHTAAFTAIFVFGTVLILSHTQVARDMVGQSVVAADYVNGIAAAALLYVLIQDRTPVQRTVYTRVAHYLSSVSYSVYVAHMPLLVFLRAAFLPNEPWRPDSVHIAYAGIVIAVVFIYGALFAQLTEAHTDRVRLALTSLVACKPSAAVQPVQVQLAATGAIQETA